MAFVVLATGLTFGTFLVLRDVAKHPEWGRYAAPPPKRAVVAVDLSWTNDMVWIPGGTFWMGSDGANPDEQPVHQVTVDAVWMDQRR